MPCDSLIIVGVTPAQRKVQVKKALTKLEELLAARKARLKVGPTGALAIDGWDLKDRDRVTDVCAVRALMSSGSSAFRQALVQAEALAGRRMNPQQVAAGTHSHDGGKTWDKGH